MSFSKPLSHCCPLLRSLRVVLEPPKDRTNCPLLRNMSEIRFASGASAQALHGSLWLKTGHAISMPKRRQLSRLLSCFGHLAASAFGGCRWLLWPQVCHRGIDQSQISWKGPDLSHIDCGGVLSSKPDVICEKWHVEKWINMRCSSCRHPVDSVQQTAIDL